MPFIIPKDLQPFCMTLGVPTEFGTCKYQMLLVLTNHQHRVVPVPLITALPRQDPTLVVVEATAVDRYAHGLKKGEGLFVREKRQRGREEERERERERERYLSSRTSEAHHALIQSSIFPSLLFVPAAPPPPVAQKRCCV